MASLKLPHWVEPHHLAYAAGFIDGDGTITINGAIRNDRKGRIDLRAYIGAYGVEREPLDFLKAMFGGSVHKHPGTRGENFMMYAWHAMARTSKDVAAMLLPYLIVKRKQAQIIVQLDAVNRQTADGKYLYYRIPEQEIARRMELRRQIRSLNRKDHLERLQ